MSEQNELDLEQFAELAGCFAVSVKNRGIDFCDLHICRMDGRFLAEFTIPAGKRPICIYDRIRVETVNDDYYMGPSNFFVSNGDNPAKRFPFYFACVAERVNP